MNRLYFVDNLKSLSDHREFPDASVDLVYLDPPFWHEKDYPRIQILTVEGVVNGNEHVDAPPQINPFAMAARESKQHEQVRML
jgi:16S rRNA G966 N2-methylase RsmD